MALPALRICDLTAALREGNPPVRIAATAKLPSRFGEFAIVAFASDDGKEHVALVRGDVKDAPSDDER